MQYGRLHTSPGTYDVAARGVYLMKKLDDENRNGPNRLLLCSHTKLIPSMGIGKDQELLSPEHHSLKETRLLTSRLQTSLKGISA